MTIYTLYTLCNEPNPVKKITEPYRYWITKENNEIFFLIILSQRQLENYKHNELIEWRKELFLNSFNTFHIKYLPLFMVKQI